MKLKLSLIGKTAKSYHQEAQIEYWNRLSRYCTKTELNVIKDIPNGSKLDIKTLKAKEAEAFAKHISDNDFLILLDEYGKVISSTQFAEKIEALKNNYSAKTIHFIIGGAYGLDQSIKNRADFTLSLSKMTFSHQNIRPILLEQIYRAFTIINNEKYHNP